MSLAELAKRKPIPFAIAMSAGPLALKFFASHAMEGFGPSWFERKISINIFPAIVGVLLLHRLGWLKAAGFRVPPAKSLVLLWLPAVITGLALTRALHKSADVPWRGFVYAALLGLSVGLTEETWHRALAMHPLRPQGAMRASVVTALLFAACHSFNLNWYPGVNVAYQLWYCLADGVLWAAIIVRTGSILPAILFHSATDFDYYLVSFHRQEFHLPAPSLRGIVLHGVVLLYGVYLLRNEPSRVDAPSPNADSDVSTAMA